MGVLHETGHALYERGLPLDRRYQPVGKARGMSIHESQSLLVEMQAGRSSQFVQYLAPLVREKFGKSGAAWEAENLYRHVTRVERGLIRVTADEVRALLHSATAFVLPSTIAGDGNRDGIPVALMEAMAVGAPVISTRVSGIPELIGDEVSGLLVAGGDANALAAAIQRLLDDAGLRERLARSAREVIERDFDSAREASKLLAAMAESIAAGASR